MIGRAAAGWVRGYSRFTLKLKKKQRPEDCSMDNMTMTIDDMSDRMAEVLGGRTA